MTLADGCFDPLHIGHIAYLHAAAHMGRPLCVRVAPDTVIRQKGRTPFQSYSERAGLILALKDVDRICGDDTLAGAVRRLKPARLVKGPDWRGRLPHEVMETCEAVGTKILFTDTAFSSSTERLTHA